jgi:signal transduction histidine kinase/DNA-binding response OmpR family regulator/CHASE3 domain sensor protein
MDTITLIDQKDFKRILSRHVTLPLGLGLVTALFFITIVFYLLSVARDIESSDYIIRKANEIVKLCIDRETGLRGFVITDQENFLEPYHQSKINLQPQLKELKKLVSENTAQVKRIDQVTSLIQQWDAYAEKAIALENINSDAATEVASGAGKKIMDNIRNEFTEFINTEENIKLNRNAKAKDMTIMMVGVFLLISTFFSAFLAYLGRRELLRLSEMHGKIVNQLINQKNTLLQQAWLRSGQTLLADQIIGRIPLPILCRNALSFLARYLGAVVGAAYTMPSGTRLKRIAEYAFSNEALAVNQEIELGQGLVGQAALEDRIIRLSGVTSDYLKINSGLGEQVPGEIIVMPLSDGQVNGVIELGFTRPITDREMTFLELIGDNIGAAIEAANYRQRLQDVATETQRLNNDLQIQQEELKVTNEELEDQSRILEESQTRLENQQQQLERNNEILEEQAFLLEQQRDELAQRNEELHEAHRMLGERAVELLRASRYKSEFLANMSHELRTPLNNALILSKLLADNDQGNLTQDQVRFAESIHSAGNDLLELINDILDISKVEAGKLDIRPEEIVLSKLLESMENSFKAIADKKQLNCYFHIDPEIPASIFSDKKRIEQILKNLLSNAIKFTEEGEVGLSIKRYSADSLAFVVKDSGIGISSDQQQLIFDAFHQADGTANRKYGGTGLGLSISRDLANLLGGNVTVESSLGEGSIFTLVLPVKYEKLPHSDALLSWHHMENSTLPAITLATPTKKAKTDPVNDDRKNLSPTERTILVIEDEPQFAQILYDLARQMHYNCLVANGAEDGFNTAIEYLPDAILLDMKLPDHSGLTVLERLKEDSRTRHIPVHVVSVEDRVEAALGMGAIGYLLKPASREQLQNIFLTLEAKLTQKVKHLLIIEGEFLQKNSILDIISDDDIQITSVSSGDAALSLLKTQVFDCMVMDTKLHDMEGEELLRHMATEEISSFPPVIIYANRNLTPDEEINLRKYSSSIIIKGVRSPEHLLDEVTLFLHKIESSMPVERQKMLKNARSRDRAFEGRTILVVDDDVRNIFALTSALEMKGATVEIGRNGREAIEKLNQISSIDLVLMDIMMPEMNGYEAISEIRKDSRFTKLPIIAVTAKAMRDDQEACLRVGANDYLAKPVEIDKLVSLIRVWMPKIQRMH